MEHTAATSAAWSTRTAEEHHAPQPVDCYHSHRLANEGWEVGKQTPNRRTVPK